MLEPYEDKIVRILNRLMDIAESLDVLDTLPDEQAPTLDAVEAFATSILDALDGTTE